MALLDHKVILCSLFEEPPNCFPQWLYHFTFPLAVCESSNFSISSPTLNFCVFLFYPPQWVWGGTSWWFWLTVVILSIFSRVYWPFTYASWEKCLFKAFASSWIVLFVFLRLTFMTSLHILDTGSLWDLWLASIFSHSVDGLFTTLIVSFDSKSV